MKVEVIVRYEITKHVDISRDEIEKEVLRAISPTSWFGGITDGKKKKKKIKRGKKS